MKAGLVMRKIKMKQIDENIETRRQKVNAHIRSEHGDKPRVKRDRPRSIDERNALTKVAKASVERAKRKGKMKMIGKRTSIMARLIEPEQSNHDIPC